MDQDVSMGRPSYVRCPSLLIRKDYGLPRIDAFALSRNDRFQFLAYVFILALLLRGAGTTSWTN
jgi:hypothetical protein